ncbi:hypothetical protein L228DRAFT_43562 [Xylona heveae TC161]|uniref:Uncharacterized protein n=1 Tax=Xylona heveae (strain CBS 132557 / TC161) TaxID=1328760 RepID=A0A164ZS19_XYLHT|nr:hypothetical protein L228DRAFT_43562 [Xylona heveae TC161]KZF19441.1 hypothetical protein L228DRAFT_43562 [Xylona heveae TC161]
MPKKSNKKSNKKTASKTASNTTPAPSEQPAGTTATVQSTTTSAPSQQQSGTATTVPPAAPSAAPPAEICTAKPSTWTTEKLRDERDRAILELTLPFLAPVLLTTSRKHCCCCGLSRKQVRRLEKQEAIHSNQSPPSPPLPPLPPPPSGCSYLACEVPESAFYIPQGIIEAAGSLVNLLPPYPPPTDPIKVKRLIDNCEKVISHYKTLAKKRVVIAIKNYKKFEELVRKDEAGTTEADAAKQALRLNVTANYCLKEADKARRRAANYVDKLEYLQSLSLEDPPEQNGEGSSGVA